jgi:hypothetical protein
VINSLFSIFHSLSSKLATQCLHSLNYKKGRDSASVHLVNINSLEGLIGSEFSIAATKDRYLGKGAPSGVFHGQEQNPLRGRGHPPRRASPPVIGQLRRDGWGWVQIGKNFPTFIPPHLGSTRLERRSAWMAQDTFPISRQPQRGRVQIRR